MLDASVALYFPQCEDVIDDWRFCFRWKTDDGQKGQKQTQSKLKWHPKRRWWMHPTPLISSLWQTEERKASVTLCFSEFGSDRLLSCLHLILSIGLLRIWHALNSQKLDTFAPAHHWSTCSCPTTTSNFSEWLILVITPGNSLNVSLGKSAKTS